MGIFSKKDNDTDVNSQPGAQNINPQQIPSSLPDTAIDKLGSGETTPYPVPKQTEQQAPPPKRDIKKIPPELVHERDQAKSRIPSSEVQVVSNSHEREGFQNEYVQQPTKDPVPQPNYHPRESLNEHNSFFQRLEEFLKNKDKNFHDYTSRDLLNKMKEFHESTRTGHNFFMHQGDAEHQIERKVEELKQLEEDWVFRRKEMDVAELFLTEKELEIETKFEELKEMMNHADKHELFNKKAPSGKHFILSNGQHLSTINDLLYALPKMDEHVFHHHVNTTKNDFYAWIRWVFSSEELSNAILPARTRSDMVSILKNY